MSERKYSRYDYVMYVIYEKIKNMIETEIHPQDIAKELRKKCRLELRLCDIEPDMLEEFYRSLAEMAWYMKHSNYDFDRLTTDKEKVWTKKH